MRRSVNGLFVEKSYDGMNATCEVVAIYISNAT